MANESLVTGTNSGSQTSTASPQTSSQGGGGFTPVTQNVQPVSGTSLLEGQGSIPLNASAPLTIVNVPSSASTVSTQSATPTQHHSANPVLLGFVGVLAFIAVAVFLQITNSAKNTTD